MNITAEGLSDSFFEAPIRGNNDNNSAAEKERNEGGDDNSEERKLLPFSVINGQNMTRDDFLVIRNAGFAVDDDN